jgi:hypothetical protein
MFRLSFSPSSEAGVQLRQWFKCPGYGVSARALTPCPAERTGLIINTNKTKYMQGTRKINITKQDSKVAGNMYEVVDQFIYLGSQINSKNVIKDEIRIQAGNRSLFGNKKLLKNKVLNSAIKLQIFKSIMRPTATYGCGTWLMLATEQNRLLVFDRRVFR